MNLRAHCQATPRTLFPPWWGYRDGTCAVPNPTKFFARSARRGSLRHTPLPRCSVGVCTPCCNGGRCDRDGVVGLGGEGQPGAGGEVQGMAWLSEALLAVAVGVALVMMARKQFGIEMEAAKVAPSMKA